MPFMCSNDQQVSQRWRKELEFHDRVATHDVREAPFRTYGLSAESIRYSQSLLRDLKGKRILELGCGDGQNTFPLLKKGALLLTGDISHRMARKARQHLETAAQKRGAALLCMQMAAEQQPIRTGSIDLVYGISILHHLDLSLGLQEIQRVLKSGGRAVFLEPLAHNPVANLYRVITPERHSDMEMPLNYEDLKNLGRLFHTINHTEFYLSSVLVALAAYVRNKSLFDLMLRFFMRLDHKLFNIFPKLRRYAWVTVIELIK